MSALSSLVRPTRSLKTSITLFTLTIFMVSLWSLSLYVSQMLRDDMERLLGEQQFSIASFGAAQIDGEITYRMRALEQLAYSIDPLLLTESSELQSRLEKQIALLNLFNEGVVVYHREGTAVAATPLLKDRIGQNDLQTDFLEGAITQGKRTVGALTRGQAHQSASFAIAVPIRNSRGYVIGALVGITNLAQPNFLDKVTETPYGRTGGYLVVAPLQRVILAATDKSRVFEAFPAIDRFIKAPNGYAVHKDPSGVEVLSSAKRIPSANWILMPTLPAAEAFAAIRNLLLRMHVATLLLTLLAGVLTWWMLKRQLSPLLSTVDVLSSMSESGESPHPLPIPRDDEIGLLIAGFNRLMDTSRRREEDLQESEARFKALHDASFGGIIIHDRGIIIDCNQGICDLSGYSREELLGMDGLQLIEPKWREIVSDRMLSGSSVPYTAEGIGKDGTVFHVSVRGQNIPYKGRAVRAVEFRDITERKRAEESLQLAANVFSHAREGIMITAPDGRIIDVNAAFSLITGYSREEVLGGNPRILRSGRHGGGFYRHMWSELVEEGFWDGEIWIRHKEGGIYAVMQNISAVRDEEGQIQYFVSLLSDITAVKEQQKQLELIAHYDSLTSLPNRVLLADRLHQAIAQATRRARKLAVAYLDLDGFKEINDQYGHATGDKLLIALAGRMKTVLREGDTLARMGGDEFVAVLLDLSDVNDCLPFLNRLLDAAAHPYAIGDRVLQVSASLGVTLYPQNEAVDPDQLLRQADQAMYQAKLAGKNRYHVFDSDQDRTVRGHHESIERIRRALYANEFVLYYQPKVNMRTGRIVGAEALIRWLHPERGLLPPGVFLPSIEDHPLAVEVGDWVINAALSQMSHWHDIGLDLSVSINIGARQLQDAEFASKLKASLAEQPTVQPSNLELEVLETSALQDVARVAMIIEACKEFGVTFALDDFGTGYSSLTYLKRLPVTQIKIDHSFVSNMLQDPNDLAILDGVLGLATSFKRQVVAEGVETIEHGEMLLQLGCEIAQGYGIARPMPAEDLPAWMALWRPDPSWAGTPPIGVTCLPLLFAGVELKAWLGGLANRLNDRSPLPESLDIHGARFRTWLEKEGVDQYGEHPAFTALRNLYGQARTNVDGLCRLHVAGRFSDIAAGLRELHEQGDDMHGLANTLLAHDQQLAGKRLGFGANKQWG